MEYLNINQLSDFFLCDLFKRKYFFFLFSDQLQKKNANWPIKIHTLNTMV